MLEVVAEITEQRTDVGNLSPRSAGHRKLPEAPRLECLAQRGEDDVLNVGVLQDEGSTH